MYLAGRRLWLRCALLRKNASPSKVTHVRNGLASGSVRCRIVVGATNQCPACFVAYQQFQAQIQRGTEIPQDTFRGDEVCLGGFCQRPRQTVRGESDVNHPLLFVACQSRSDNEVCTHHAVYCHHSFHVSRGSRLRDGTIVTQSAKYPRTPMQHWKEREGRRGRGRDFRGETPIHVAHVFPRNLESTTIPVIDQRARR